MNKEEIKEIVNEVLNESDKSNWKLYKRKGLTEMRPFIKGEKLNDYCSVSEADKKEW